ncbi:pyruvate dehydrogenase complex E2 component dihydrolipoamide acetyltransferase [Patulibacter medicamentivorans]|uniref:Dihydrolipoamide acetyltransferase component of pyruvate dehydrogenase complex n=1 Tax=Patulibacter medicamentivorans TaxID=1097667 RepID=H0E659_9ACTN|nr:dihydrolipoamide acetyltransferase family protein [Patulibacter medicamentivorans]EHN10828.1 pyruvate dehydrogenase complex E2 component dihydrolipoamide acetyltransferase [Patulibacter medicamentivorans]
MPQLGLEVTEGVVVELFVLPGATVTKDLPLLELETDKASTEVVAPRDGVLRAWSVGVGDAVPVGDVLALIADTADEPLEAESSAVDTAAAEAGVPPGADDARAAGVGAAVSGASGSGSPGAGDAPDGAPRRRVAPVARRAAAALGVSLAAVEGTGPRGRVTLDDVRRAAAAESAPATSAGPLAAPAPGAASGTAEELPISAIRRAIARRMRASQLIPQYQLQRDIDASHLLAQKAAQAEGRNAAARIGVNDLLVQALAETVRRHPELAVTWVDGDDGPRMIRSGADGVGLAVASDKGLVVPVIRDPQTAGLAAIAEQRQRLVAAARGGTLGLDEMAGAAITLSNLGGFGVDRFTAMLNPGESAIVAVGRTVERVVPRRRGTAVVPVLAVTVSFDHRVIDGAVGAAALGTLAALLEGDLAWRP